MLSRLLAMSEECARVAERLKLIDGSGKYEIK
jgi:hypothetical protein